MDQLEERKQKLLAKLEANGGRTQSQRAKILKLKRKVVYTYEYSDDSDKEQSKPQSPHNRPPNSKDTNNIVVDK